MARDSAIFETRDSRHRVETLDGQGLGTRFWTKSTESTRASSRGTSIWACKGLARSTLRVGLKSFRKLDEDVQTAVIPNCGQIAVR